MLAEGEKAAAASRDDDIDDLLSWELYKGDWPFWKHAVAGSMAGVMEHIALFPLDTIKTHLQTTRAARSIASYNAPNIGAARDSITSNLNALDPKNGLNANPTSINPNVSSFSNGAFSETSSENLAANAKRSYRFNNCSKLGGTEIAVGMRSLYEEGGMFRFFRGATAITAGCLPAHASYFSIYEFFKYSFSFANSGNFLPIYAAISGASATVVHDFILTPTDLVKQRLQLGCYSGPLECVRTVLKNEGIVAFFRSVPTTMMMNVPFGAVSVSINELLKSFLNISQYAAECRQNQRMKAASITKGFSESSGSDALVSQNDVDDSEQPKTIRPPASALLLYFFCAGVGGGAAGIVSNPFDVIKTRLQTQDIILQKANANRNTISGQQIRGSPVASGKYKSFWSTVSLILKEEGPRAFWKGTSARAALCVPASAVSWGTYEFLKYLLTVQWATNI